MVTPVVSWNKIKYSIESEILDNFEIRWIKNFFEQKNTRDTMLGSNIFVTESYVNFRLINYLRIFLATITVTANNSESNQRHNEIEVWHARVCTRQANGFSSRLFNRFKWYRCVVGLSDEYHRKHRYVSNIVSIDREYSGN